MSCATIMIIIKLIKPFTHVDIHIYTDDALKYTFHLALSSPIKISISYMPCSHIIKLKLEIKLIYLLHLSRLLKFLRYSSTCCVFCPKLVNSQHSRGWQSRVVVKSCTIRMLGSKPWAHHLITVLKSGSCCIS